MNILLLASHAVAEFDDVRMFSDLGYDIFAPGGYEIPSRSGEGIRPALPDAPHHPELVRLCEAVRLERGEPGAAIDWAKAALHPDLIDWADTIIVHHFPERWIGWQFDRIRHKRVIWRTCGQSNEQLEEFMGAFRRKGLEIVRYSPAEERFYAKAGVFAGQDALIRFGKYPDDYGPWTGEWNGVINITQNLVQRGDSCGYPFWRDATAGLARPSGLEGPDGPFVMPIGAGSEVIGGLGAVSYEDMLWWLRNARAYLYTGTVPASYTLGLIEAMMTGIPVVSIGPEAWKGPALLFEGSEIVTGGQEYAHAESARRMLTRIFGWPRDMLQRDSDTMRQRAIELFGIETIGAQWREFLA